MFVSYVCKFAVFQYEISYYLHRKMSFSINLLHAALLAIFYFVVSTYSECLDFNDVDVCADLGHVDRLQLSFGGCDATITPHNARHEPVVKYDNADEVPPPLLITLIIHFLCVHERMFKVNTHYGHCMAYPQGNKALADSKGEGTCPLPQLSQNFFQQAAFSM